MNEHKLYIAIDAEALLGSYAPELYAELARIDPTNPILAKARGE